MDKVVVSLDIRELVFEVLEVPGFRRVVVSVVELRLPDVHENLENGLLLHHEVVVGVFHLICHEAGTDRHQAGQKQSERCLHFVHLEIRH